MNFTGTWHIYEMDMWGEDYYNMEVQAFIKIDSHGSGHFQFGLVQGYIDGELVDGTEGSRLEFTWDGNDECDMASGSGWLESFEEDRIKGKIKIHLGDSSLFWARRA